MQEKTWYYEKWVGRQAAFSPSQYVKTYLIKIFIFCAKSFNFDQTYLNTNPKTQKVEDLRLDQIFHDNFSANAFPDEG